MNTNATTLSTNAGEYYLHTSHELSCFHNRYKTELHDLIGTVLYSVWFARADRITAVNKIVVMFQVRTRDNCGGGGIGDCGAI